MKMKKCTTCKETKELLEFGKDKSRSDGLNAKCKECDRSNHKAKRRADPIKAREADREYYLRRRGRADDVLRVRERNNRYYHEVVKPKVTQTANAVVKVFDRLSPEEQQHYSDVLWKHDGTNAVRDRAIRTDRVDQRMSEFEERSDAEDTDATTNNLNDNGEDTNDEPITSTNCDHQENGKDVAASEGAVPPSSRSLEGATK
jgi:hypothetical protein